MTNLLLDVRFALRALRRSPLFSTVAILSVALGIGCNTAIFTLLDQILLRQLPVKDPDQLVMLYQRGAHNGSNMGDRMHSYPIYQDFQQKAKPFAEVLCRRLISTSVTVDEHTERVDAENAQRATRLQQFGNGYSPQIFKHREVAEKFGHADQQCIQRARQKFWTLLEMRLESSNCRNSESPQQSTDASIE